MAGLDTMGGKTVDQSLGLIEETQAVLEGLEDDLEKDRQRERKENIVDEVIKSLSLDAKFLTDHGIALASENDNLPRHIEGLGGFYTALYENRYSAPPTTEIRFFNGQEQPQFTLIFDGVVEGKKRSLDGLDLTSGVISMSFDNAFQNFTLSKNAQERDEQLHRAIVLSYYYGEATSDQAVYTQNLDGQRHYMYSINEEGKTIKTEVKTVEKKQLTSQEFIRMNYHNLITGKREAPQENVIDDGYNLPAISGGQHVYKGIRLSIDYFAIQDGVLVYAPSKPQRQ